MVDLRYKSLSIQSCLLAENEGCGNPPPLEPCNSLRMPLQTLTLATLKSQPRQPHNTLNPLPGSFRRLSRVADGQAPGDARSAAVM